MSLFYFVSLDICRGGAVGFDVAGQQALWSVVSKGGVDAGTISSVYFCLGVPIFFYLLFKARFIPRVISLLGMLTALSVLVTTLATITAPALGARLQVVGLPLAGVEILTGLWLLIGGASLNFWNSGHREPQPT
jgi:hypothetical protein